MRPILIVLSCLVVMGCQRSVLVIAKDGHPKEMQKALAAGGDPNDADAEGLSALYWAAARGHKRTVASLLDHGANVHFTAPQTLDTPLHAAAGGGHLKTVTMLLGAGASPAARNAIGATPLHAAARGGHLETITVLLDAGANPADRSAAGATPLDEAMRNGHSEAAALLR